MLIIFYEGDVPDLVLSALGTEGANPGPMGPEFTLLVHFGVYN